MTARLKNQYILFVILMFTLLNISIFAVFGQTQEPTEQAYIVFTASQDVRIHADRSQDSPLILTMETGESVPIRLPYVYNDELIWAPVLGDGGYVALARYGSCDIRSFGTYSPNIPPVQEVP